MDTLSVACEMGAIFCVLFAQIIRLSKRHITPSTGNMKRHIYTRNCWLPTADCIEYSQSARFQFAFSAHTARRHVEIVHLIKMAMWYSYKPYHHCTQAYRRRSVSCSFLWIFINKRVCVISIFMFWDLRFSIWFYENYCCMGCDAVILRS